MLFDKRSVYLSVYLYCLLNFYINRAGRRLPLNRRKVLELAKNELREVFGRPEKNSRVSR